MDSKNMIARREAAYARLQSERATSVARVPQCIRQMHCTLKAGHLGSCTEPADPRAEELAWAETLVDHAAYTLAHEIIMRSEGQS